MLTFIRWATADGYWIRGEKAAVGWLYRSRPQDSYLLFPSNYHELSPDENRQIDRFTMEVYDADVKYSRESAR